MNDTESVKQFHAGGEALAGMRGIYELSARALDVLIRPGGRLLDLGSGSGRGLGCLLALRPDIRATGVDLAPNMLSEARRFLDAQGVGERVSLVEGDLTEPPAQILRHRWDAISSVWALHHLPDTASLRAALHLIARLRDRDGSAVWLFDFQRLPRPGSFRDVLGVWGDALSTLYADALASEAAAFTHGELGAALTASGLGDLDSGLAQPVPWLQAFWGHGRPEGAAATRNRAAPTTGGGSRNDEPDLAANFSNLPR